MPMAQGLLSRVSRNTPTPLLRQRETPETAETAKVQIVSASGCVLAAAQAFPQRARPGLGVSRADLLAPERLRAEIAPPHPEPARVVVQDVLMGEAHGAHRLVRDGGDALGKVRGLRLGRGDRKAAAVLQSALIGVARRRLG